MVEGGKVGGHVRGKWGNGAEEYYILYSVIDQYMQSLICLPLISLAKHRVETQKFAYIDINRKPGLLARVNIYIYKV
jgi:hypothetical protein